MRLVSNGKYWKTVRLRSLCCFKRWARGVCQGDRGEYLVGARETVLNQLISSLPPLNCFYPHKNLLGRNFGNRLDSIAVSVFSVDKSEAEMSALSRVIELNVFEHYSMRLTE